jgi:hypothetical protein
MPLGPVFTVVRMRPLPLGLRAGHMLAWMLTALAYALHGEQLFSE